MAYKTEELEKQALEVIKKENLHFIEDICYAMGIDKGTFYAHKLNETDAIKEAILQNKRKIKQSLRSKWYKSTNPTLQIALYRLLADKREFDALVQNKQTIGAAEGEEVTIIIEKTKKDDTQDQES